MSKGKVLFLHGLFATGSFKALHMSSLGYEVCAPDLGHWDFIASLKVAQDAYDKFKPDVVVGSSRGAAVALNLETDAEVPLILLAPAWKTFGKASKVVNRRSVIIHSPKDEIVPHGDSLELFENSTDAMPLLWSLGCDHRLNCVEGRKALEEALEITTKKAG